METKKVLCSLREEEYNWVNSKGYKFSFLLRRIINEMMEREVIHVKKQLLDG